MERGVRTLRKNLIANIKSGERFGMVLDMSLNVKRETAHTRLGKSAFELHYSRKPNTEISNLLNLDNIEKVTKFSNSAKPDTMQVYSFSGAGGVYDQLPMKLKKNTKGVSNYHLLFLEKNTDGTYLKVHIPVNHKKKYRAKTIPYQPSRESTTYETY